MSGPGWRRPGEVLAQGEDPLTALRSARHIVSWIPEPRLGDATAIGYLRRLVPGRQLSWWAPGIRYPYVEVSLAIDMLLRPSGEGSRLVVRISGDGVGPMAHPVIWSFRIIDSIMAIRQLVVIKKYVETFGARSEEMGQPETDDRARYQLYQTIYASGGWAGVYGREQVERWRRISIEDGVESSDA